MTLTNEQNHINYQRIEQAIQYLQENFLRQPELGEVAERVHLSPFHFQRLFTAWAGISPKRFLQYLTTGYLKEKLKVSQNIEEAAAAAGRLAHPQTGDADGPAALLPAVGVAEPAHGTDRPLQPPAGEPAPRQLRPDPVAAARATAAGQARAATTRDSVASILRVRSGPVRGARGARRAPGPDPEPPGEDDDSAEYKVFLSLIRERFEREFGSCIRASKGQCASSGNRANVDHASARGAGNFWSKKPDRFAGERQGARLAAHRVGRRLPRGRPAGAGAGVSGVVVPVAGATWVLFAAMRDKEKQAKEKLEAVLNEWRQNREEKRVSVNDDDILQVVAKWTTCPPQLTAPLREKLIQFSVCGP